MRCSRRWPAYCAASPSTSRSCTSLDLGRPAGGAPLRAGSSGSPRRHAVDRARLALHPVGPGSHDRRDAPERESAARRPDRRRHPAPGAREADHHRPGRPGPPGGAPTSPGPAAYSGWEYNRAPRDQSGLLCRWLPGCWSSGAPHTAEAPLYSPVGNVSRCHRPVTAWRLCGPTTAAPAPSATSASRSSGMIVACSANSPLRLPAHYMTSTGCRRDRACRGTC